MKNHELAVLHRLGEVNSNLQHKWKCRHGGKDPINDADNNLLVGDIMTVIGYVVGGIIFFLVGKDPSRYSLAAFLLVILDAALISIGIWSLKEGRTAFGTHLKKLCELFGCNFGELAKIKFEKMCEMALTQIEDAIYVLVDKEFDPRYGKEHPTTKLSRANYDNLLSTFTEVELHDGRVDELFAKATKLWKESHPEAISTSTH